jgi:hypothetical protein
VFLATATEQSAQIGSEALNSGVEALPSVPLAPVPPLFVAASLDVYVSNVGTWSSMFMIPHEGGTRMSPTFCGDTLP